jgi:beta-glucanase (GH16 family)
MKIYFYYFLIILSMAGAWSVQAQGYKLIWSDEFNGTQLDATNWTKETGGGGWGNNELEYYTDRDVNAFVSNGLLTIKAMSEVYGGRNYTSARIKTQGKRFFKYGKIEARMKLPYGQGIWPAFWMLGESIASIGWPACGELDIMEMVGGSSGNNKVYGTAHWDNGGHQSYGSNYALPAGNLCDDFHTYALVWEPQKLEWYIDDIKYCSLAITADYYSEFRENAFIIFNLAVGGNWPGSPDASTVFPQTLQVDYVRVYQDTLALPSVSMVTPADNAVFSAGSDITLSADARCVDDIKSVEFYQDAVKIGETAIKPFEITWRNVQTGCYKVSANAITSRGFSKMSNTVQIKVGDSCGKAPYKGYLQTIPGKLEGENFDLGGNGVGYYDTDAANTGGAYRPTESVDIQACTDVNGGYNIGWIYAGEWLSYSINVTETNTYDFNFRAASSNAAGGDISAAIDGVDVTGLVHITSTGGLQTWATFSKKNIALKQGVHTLKILFNTAGYNFNYLTVTKSATPTFLTITFPNGGETLKGGAIQEIRWNSSSVDRIKIGLTTNNGGTWSYVSADFPAEFGSYRFVVPDVATSSAKIMIVDKANAANSDASDSLFMITPASAVKGEVPETYAVKLYPVFPNPSNPTATVRFTIPGAAGAQGVPFRLQVFDVTGRLVAAPAVGNFSAGTHEVILPNKELASGVYAVVLRAGSHVANTKMIVLK